MFFELHNENKIGYKQLTDADLGRKTTSNQTHIGLFGDVFTFLPNDIEIDDAMVIFNGNVEFFSANFNRIENPNHTFRSPKIKTGGRNAVSVVTFIRDKSKEYSKGVVWYLFWFGLKSEQPVFFLFNKNSDTYNDMVSIGVDLKENIKAKLEPTDSTYSALLNYLEDIVNKSGKAIAEELEVIAQTNDKSVSNYRTYDIDRARNIFSEIGRAGEELVNKYFTVKLKKNHIAHYEWKNKDKESGLPYDFSVETLQGEILYLDVKTTNHGFEQKMIFSSQEIKFVDGCHNKYFIYRVYSNGDKKYLKICDNAKDLFSPIYNKTTDFENILDEMAKVESIKVAILPLHKSLVFGNEIELEEYGQTF